MALQTTFVRGKRKKFFATDQMIQIAWTESRKYNLKLHIAMGFAIWRGFRVTECCYVNLDDFRNSSDLTRFNAILEKSHIKDDFPLIEDFARELRHYVQENLHTFKQGYLFSSYSTNARPCWNKSIAESTLSKFRKHLGKTHPEFLEHTRELTRKYRMLKAISSVGCNIDVLRATVGGYKCTLQKILQELYLKQYLHSDGTLTRKAIIYISKEHYSVKYLFSWHTMRRWFETRIWKKYKDQMLLRDIMRYSKAETVNVYINPYEVWCKEHEIMKDVFGQTYRDFENLGHGQTRLDTFTNNKD